MSVKVRNVFFAHSHSPLYKINMPCRSRGDCSGLTPLQVHSVMSVAGIHSQKKPLRRYRRVIISLCGDTALGFTLVLDGDAHIPDTVVDTLLLNIVYALQ